MSSRAPEVAVFWRAVDLAALLYAAVVTATMIVPAWWRYHYRGQPDVDGSFGFLLMLLPFAVPLLTSAHLAALLVQRHRLRRGVPEWYLPVVALLAAAATFGVPALLPDVPAVPLAILAPFAITVLLMFIAPSSHGKSCKRAI